MDRLRSDLRTALRVFRSHPGTVAAAIVMLGLGMGASAAMFSVVQAVLLRPLPVADPNHLVVFFASAIPARRAAAIDPALTLRSD